MSSAIQDFFAAWAIQDDAARDAKIDGTLSSLILYADPRTDAPLTDAEALKAYVGQFSKMAPGMPVAATHTSSTLNFVRATVRFGEGDQSQLGQYTIDLDETGKITRAVGFVGIGEA